MLRAVFAMLENEENVTDEVENFIREIQPAIWLKNEMTGKVDRTKTLLRSEVATDQRNEILRKILETGVADKEAKDNYSRNYNKFLELYARKREKSSMQIYHFILALLNYSILLPISADNQDTALTIFSTLNNRGLPLSDADIFKSVLYKQLDANAKKKFAHQWKELEAEANRFGESLQSLFGYHLFYLRALEGDNRTTTPGLRKFFMEKGKNRLQTGIIDELSESLKLWKVVKGGESIEDETWSQNSDILKVLDILREYNNEYWKYPTLIYYNRYKKNPDFERLFLKFLRKLSVMLLTRYLETPTINAIKGDVFKLNNQIILTSEPSFFAGFKEETTDEMRLGYLVAPHRNVVRMLLKMLAYNMPEQKGLLPDKWEIEHIFPQKWSTGFFTLDPEETKMKLEFFGNKIPLQKEMNIKASNDYFARKRLLYEKSGIAMANRFANLDKSDWLPKDIDERNGQIFNELTSLFNQWIADYEPKAESRPKPIPTAEDLEMMRILKEKGLI